MPWRWCAFAAFDSVTKAIATIRVEVRNATLMAFRPLDYIRSIAFFLGLEPPYEILGQRWVAEASAKTTPLCDLAGPRGE